MIHHVTFLKIQRNSWHNIEDHDNFCKKMSSQNSKLCSQWKGGAGGYNRAFLEITRRHVGISFLLLDHIACKAQFHSKFVRAPNNQSESSSLEMFMIRSLSLRLINLFQIYDCSFTKEIDKNQFFRIKELLISNTKVIVLQCQAIKCSLKWH